MILNTHQFNTGLFNGGATIAPMYSSDILVFEGFSLSDGVVMTLTGPPVSGPTRELTGGNTPRGNGKFLTSAFFRETPIYARGKITQATAADLDSFLDTLKKTLRTKEGVLDYTDAAGTVKRYLATVESFDVLFADREASDVTKCPFNIRFVAYDFATSRNYTSNFFSISSSPDTETIVHAGSAEAKPYISITFNTASSVTVVNLQRLTTAGVIQEEIEYAGSIVAGDILTFDSELCEVRKNGTIVNYIGGFPELDPDANLVKLTVTGSAFTADMTVKHKTRYL